MTTQDYFAIRRDCCEKGILYEDPEFPACNSLLPSFSVSGNMIKVDEWKRPGELCRNPKFFVDEFSRFDIKQGKIGDCWFLAAVTNLTLNAHLFDRVVCESNSFDKEYAGIFHFHFWDYDKWKSVVIDDRLPTYDNKLVFAHSADENEFWIALLEKAFAKFKGNYKVLSLFGTLCEAAEDLSGGISEKFCVKLQTSFNPHCCYKHVCFDDLEKSFSNGNSMGCFIRNVKSKDPRTKEKLVLGHAFSITSVKRLYIEKSGEIDEVQLLRLRNPWGSGFEWTGAWSDNCSKWNDIPFDIRNELLRPAADGEFWMSYEDFHKHFDITEICSLTPESLVKLNEDCAKKMKKKVFDDNCLQKINGKFGDCSNGLCNNPRCLFTFAKNNSTAIFTIARKNVRKLMLKNSDDKYTPSLGLTIRRIADDTKMFCLQENETPKNHLQRNEIKVFNEIAPPPRSTYRLYNIPQGQYAMILNNSQKYGEFYIRVYSEREYSSRIKKIQLCMKFFETFWMRRVSRF